MDYGQLLRRAWDTVWAHKYLILLGVLVALLSSGGNASGSGLRFDGSDFDFDGRMPRDFREFRDFEDIPMPRFRGPAEGGLAIAGGLLLVVVICIGAVIGLVLWGIATTARGGLIAGVDAATSGEASSFGQAFGAGWRRLGHLLAIGIVPGIPTLLALVAGVGVTGMAAIVTQGFTQGGRIIGPGLAAIFVPVLCILIPIAVALSTLRAFANRACMLENESFLAAYRRGWDVLIANIGPAVVLAAIQIGINIAMGMVMIVPGIFMALCCVLWPVLLVIEGFKAAYFSTVWTLAWQEWTETE